MLHLVLINLSLETQLSQKMQLLKKILVVDDDADDREFFLEAIKEIDPAILCDEAKDGLEAITILETVPPPPSLIFLDLNMPIMSGMEVLEKVKSIHKEIPIIIYTTTSNLAQKAKSIAMGANFFLTKESDFSRIKAQLRHVLQMNFTIS